MEGSSLVLAISASTVPLFAPWTLGWSFLGSVSAVSNVNTGAICSLRVILAVKAVCAGRPGVNFDVAAELAFQLFSFTPAKISGTNLTPGTVT
ncbi:hypothetical protein PF005_g460 [Phytophthora fragariae]|uniref:Uncharacterized protein n=1 Tax=Phytophthora fragariae TaxID=53985 RepID=A0A6A3FRP2_9STRA|nr:hypothetical protein PF003_g13206 [Phytophthora fragariae]KAE8946700.1 hypothetical protein PF009_g3669 [Phytophthora fragariae]KAE9140926.1 hypothetical protein PF007_g466 [Phytophthora fragariae]KAE9153416.1 hypothetical protein PF006_g2464 [Phytophthora fragariae]KAE9237880.1 hypothetical protein PF005_g460 [Phytophthora fragariae]